MTILHSIAGLLLVCCGLAASAADISADAAAEDTAFRNALRSAATQVADGREAWAMLKLAAFRPGVLDQRSTAMLEDLVAAARDDDPVILRDAMNQDRGLRAHPERADWQWARLQTIDPDNAYNALWEMMLAPTDAAGSRDDERVQRMAGATHYADDFLPVLRTTFQVLARGYGIGNDPTANPGDDRSVAAMSFAMAAATATALPPFQPLTQACDARQFPQRAAACREIARRLASDGNHMIVLNMASVVSQKAATNVAERREAANVHRQLRWLTEAQQGALSDMGSSPRDVSPRDGYFATLLDDGEPDAIRAQLRARGLPLEPPADWQEPPLD